VSLLLLLTLAGCARPVDPLAAQREALTLALEAPLPDGWAPHASLVVRQSVVEGVVLEALSRAMAVAVAPVEQSFFGLTASMTPTVSVTSARMSAGEGCEGCLSVTLALEGGAEMALENPTGRREQRVDWTGEASGTVLLRLDEDGRRVVAEIADPKSWRASVDFAQVPGGWNSAISSALSAGLQAQVGRPSLPAIPLVRLEDDPRARLKGLRVRTAEVGVVVDFAFALASAGAVVDLQAPPAEADWAVVVPAATALGMLRTAALSQPFTSDAPVVPELAGLSLEDGFVLDVLAWPTRGRGGAREVTVYGDVALVDGDVNVSVARAELVEQEGVLPDLAALLYGDRVLGELADAMSLTVPGARTQSVGGVALSGRTSSVSTADGALVLSGEFEVSAEGEH